MPCNAVTVMQFHVEAEGGQLATAFQIFKRFAVGNEITDHANVVRMQASLPRQDGTTMPVRVAIEPNGRITVVTSSGTYQEGKEVLERVVLQALRSSSLKSSGLKFETHVHSKRAPKLAYGRAAAQRG